MNPPRSSSESGGRVEVMANGEHRWVSDGGGAVGGGAVGSGAVGSGTVGSGTVGGGAVGSGAGKLDYASEGSTRGRWVINLIGFIVGGPLGFLVFGVGIGKVWSTRMTSSPAPVVLAACVATIVSGGFFVRGKYGFFGWLAFGAGCGLFVAGMMMWMFWGWHDC